MAKRRKRGDKLIVYVHKIKKLPDYYIYMVAIPRPIYKAFFDGIEAFEVSVENGRLVYTPVRAQQ